MKKTSDYLMLTACFRMGSQQVIVESWCEKWPEPVATPEDFKTLRDHVLGQERVISFVGFQRLEDKP